MAAPKKGTTDLIVEDGRVVSWKGVPPYGWSDEDVCQAAETWHAMRMGVPVEEGIGQLVRAVVVDRTIYVVYSTRMRRVVEAVGE